MYSCTSAASSGLWNISFPTQYERPCEYAVIRSCSSGPNAEVVAMLKVAWNALIILAIFFSNGLSEPSCVAVRTFWNVRASNSVSRKPFGPYMGWTNTADSFELSTMTRVAPTARHTPAWTDGINQSVFGFETWRQR